MHLSREIREYLGHMWKIPRSGVSEIRDQEVVSDGHTYEDLSVITLDLMNRYIGSEETFARAWEVTIAKAFSELHPPVGIIQKNVEDSELEESIPPIETTGGEDIPTEVIVPGVPRKPGRPKSI